MVQLFRSLLIKTSNRRKRVGRGISAGGGKTAGRGTKGQRSRSGANRKLPAWFEGGQTPLYRKLPKRSGFTRVRKRITVTTSIINNHYRSGEIVSPATLAKKRIIRPRQLEYAIKIIGEKPLVKVTFADVTLSSGLKAPQQNGDPAPDLAKSRS